MRHILFFIESFSGGGAEKVLLTILRHLNYHRFEVTVLVMNDVGALYCDFHRLPVRIVSVIPIGCLLYTSSQIRSSKYLQSNAEGIYRHIQSLLKQDKLVFFCGTPCQIKALHLFLRKDYENLITCDFVCRGVNSPKVFLSYMKMLEKEFKSTATNIKFKAKDEGWHNFSMRVKFANGKEYCKNRWQDLFFIGYLQNGVFTRPSCFACRFKGFPRTSDITLADFWGIENIDPSMDQDLSLIHI